MQNKTLHQSAAILFFCFISVIFSFSRKGPTRPVQAVNILCSDWPEEPVDHTPPTLAQVQPGGRPFLTHLNRIADINSPPPV